MAVRRRAATVIPFVAFWDYGVTMADDAKRLTDLARAGG